MRKLAVLFLLSVIFSCGGTSSENAESGNFKVSIDTVLIDAGDQLIFHQSGLSHTSLSNDQKQLFIFSPKDEFQIIDLDSLKLNLSIPTQKEGPLGTGMPYAIQLDQSGRVVLFGFGEVRFFSPNLSVMDLHRLTPETLDGLNSTDILGFNTKLSEDGVDLYSIYVNTEQLPQGLAIISFENKQVKKIPFDIASKVLPYIYSLVMDGRLMSRGHDGLFLELIENQLLLSTPYSNEAILFDLEKSTVTIKKFNSELTQDSKPIPVKTEVGSFSELQNLRQEAQKSVTFGPFIFDKKSQRVYRFSQDLDREIDDSLVFKSILTVFDQDFNQLVEQEVSVDPLSKKFFKDGKLWSYVNVEDELGFAVMEFKF
ncbi:MAG: DUF4221 family protein [Algoriphagus aquaeductus]|uniref:DUF4221 family protein n=1 Tax=Algoriphagus aquaeductus TaxID=475299 RepID=UPI003919A9FE